MSGILFNNVPQNVRTPLFYAEFQPGGTPLQQRAKLLLPGQKLAAGIATANVPVRALDASIDKLCGFGSMLSAQYRAARRLGPLQDIWILPLDDDDAGALASGSIKVANAPVSQSGTVVFYITGERLRVIARTGDTNADIAAAVAAAINARPDLPVTAAVDGTDDTKVNTTARHKGEQGNYIEIDLGRVTEEPPHGFDLLTITAMSGGSGDPDLTEAFGNLGDIEFDWIAAPYGDANVLGDVSDLLGDVSGRWSYVSQLYGHYIGANASTVTALATLGNGRNDAHASIFPCRRFRSPPWEVVAAVGARAARHLQAPGSSAELSRPLQSLELTGIKGPLDTRDYLQPAEAETLLYDGVSTYYVDAAGAVRISRLVTTYQRNAYDDEDATYLDVNTMAQSMYGIRYLRQKVTNTHGRKALADKNPSNNPGIVTPEDIYVTLVHGYEDLVALGVFENAHLFRRDLRVERDLVDANRVNASLPLDHVNQLRVMAAAAVNYMQRTEPRDALVA